MSVHLFQMSNCTLHVWFVPQLYFSKAVTRTTQPKSTLMVEQIIEQFYPFNYYFKNNKSTFTGSDEEPRNPVTLGGQQGVQNTM